MSQSSKTTELACSLNEEEYRDRRKFVRESLIPKILETEKSATGLQLVFEDTDSVRSDVELFVELESQCCGFLNFAITSTSHGLVLTIEGPPEAKGILAKFASGFAMNGKKGLHRKEIPS